ncbi:MAG: hypothetical protein LBE78_06260 [Burkholderiaceae bacterium]|jgi:hypothetical protein|nr:hypothetical protein [Burkholderiaceae bacterium]
MESGNQFIKYLPLLFLVFPFSVLAQRSECPAFNNATSNILINARLFDGPIADQIELAPDNEHGATWDIRGYKAAGRAIILVCEYKNHTKLSVPVNRSANWCYFKGKKKRTAWCDE